MVSTINERICAYIGIGSNLGNPQRQVAEACIWLDTLPESSLVCRSSDYYSRPLMPLADRPGKSEPDSQACDQPDSQPDYCNAVAELETCLTAEALLEALLQLEASLGRTRNGRRWAPRIIDLDLLLWGERVLDTPGLTLPHPEISKRDFVLRPLLEIAPELILPGQGSHPSSLQDLVAACAEQTVYSVKETK